MRGLRLQADWAKLLYTVNPYHGFPADRYPADLQGWGYESPIFDHVIATYRPARMVEVGTWKGASAIRIAALMKQYKIPQPQLVCVDTWLGSVEMRNEHDLPQRYFGYGYPMVYATFLANVIRAGHQDVIVPFAIDASNGAKFFLLNDMRADAIYLDASHEYEDVAADLVSYWRVLRPGGVFFGDDYAGYWPGVIKAVDEFAARAQLKVRIDFQGKFLIDKPSDGHRGVALR